jgi:GT2 family glycosyltransferase
VPALDWLAEHERGFRARGGGDELAVLGYSNWDRRLKLTRFLRYLNEEGLQFGYSLIDQPEQVPFNFFYTSNVSLARQRLLDEPFDEEFPYAAWEDIEAAYRLTRRGLRLVYQPSASVAHHHPTDFARFCRRQERAGYCAVVVWQRHPELGSFVGVGPDGPPPLPPRSLQWLREALVRTLQPFPLSTPRLWYETLRFHYVQGLKRAWRERIVEPGGAR